MENVIPIHQAKTNLSKLVKQASAGKDVYIGAYGQPQVVITAVPQKKPIKIGVYAHKYKVGDFDDAEVIGSDPQIIKEFEHSTNKPFPNE